MTGLLLIIATAGWILLVAWIARRAATLVPNPLWSKGLWFVAFLMLVPLPLLDEIIAAWQFSELCRKNVVHVHAETAQGKTVYLEHASRSPVANTAVRIWTTPQHFVDSSTGMLIVSYDLLQAEGGALVRGVDSGNYPLTFNGECHPPGVFEKSFLYGLGITRVMNPRANPFALK